MRNPMLTLVLLLGAFIWFSSASKSVPPPGKIRFVGKVIDVYTDQALAGVKVTCEAVSTTTDTKGKFTLSVPDKKKKFYKISFSKKGYMNDHLDSIAADRKEEILIGLMKQPR